MFSGIELPGASDAHVELRQRRRILLELRVDLQNDVYWLLARVDLRHPARAVRVVQRRFDLIRR